MLGRFFKLFERKSDAYDALLGIGLTTAANIAVTPELALKCVPVYRGVSVRCEVLGSLPFMLYRRRDDGGKDRATDHPLYKLIHDRPNPWTSATEFVMQLEVDCITDGGGYALANRSGDKIVELIRLAPRSVCVDIDDATLEPKYEVTLKNGTKRTNGASECSWRIPRCICWKASRSPGRSRASWASWRSPVISG
jgi:phage portal protein BeeE